MLVVKRRPKQRVRLVDSRSGALLGHVEIVEAAASAVRLGFDLPAWVAIAREELPAQPPAAADAA